MEAKEFYELHKGKLVRNVTYDFKGKVVGYVNHNCIIVSSPRFGVDIGNFDGADLTGFEAMIQTPENVEAYIMVRRTNDAKGNTSGGYEDARFANNIFSNKQVNLTGTNATQKAWFNATYLEAQKLAKANDLFPSIMMSQAIAESAWGQSELATKANNLFGIKADTTWKGAK